MTFPANFELSREKELYALWENSGAFKPSMDPSKEPYCILMPPPNATGQLHLGHATMLAIQDILIRYQRMQGKDALYLPGTDHAAIATQSVVEKQLFDKGIKTPLETLGREAFLDEIRAFVAQSQSTIKSQVRSMGASCDWTRERYTFSDDMNHAVNTLFIHMFEDGLIYRGGRIVNWDPKMQTTVADDELEYEEEKTPFYYFQFGPIVIGTSRPETKFLDEVIVVHPEDERYKAFVGQEFELEWIEGKVKAKVIADECIDPDLGTGAMTISPAHSLVDFELAQKYDFASPQIIDLEGKILASVSKSCAGLSVKEARLKVVEILKEKGLLVKVDEDYEHNVAVNYRGKGVVEPQIMEQWFVDVQKPAVDWFGEKLSFKQILQRLVKDKMVEIIPEKFEKTYFHWIDHLRDWCISRQIVWGHRIPVWYKGEEVKACVASPGEGWLQDEDTLDTWFSSGLWTFSTLGWPAKTEDLMRFAPSAVLETGYDILFFWVARMMLQTTYAMRKSGFSEEKSIPFSKVYLHGLIRDIHGKKMSKSRPETCIDPLETIAKYGTDATRLSVVLGGTPGNDMRLYEEKIAGYRNFVNKIWNGSKFASMNVADFNQAIEASTWSDLDKALLSKLSKQIRKSTHQLDTFALSDAGTELYEFFWSEFCDWFLEFQKLRPNPSVLAYTLKALLKMLHPFMPFVTEEIWSHIGAEGLLIQADWPQAQLEHSFEEEEAKVELLKEAIREIRSLRAESNIEAVLKIKALLKGENLDFLEQNADIICRMANLASVEFMSSQDSLSEDHLSAVHAQFELLIPLAGAVDLEKEKARLQKELVELQAYAKNISAKLSNEGFVSRAPHAVVEQEKAKLHEAQEKIRVIEGKLG